MCALEDAVNRLTVAATAAGALPLPVATTSALPTRFCFLCEIKLITKLCAASKERRRRHAWDPIRVLTMYRMHALRS